MTPLEVQVINNSLQATYEKENLVLDDHDHLYITWSLQSPLLQIPETDLWRCTSLHRCTCEDVQSHSVVTTRNVWPH